MATLAEITNRVRLELADLASTFSETFVADGQTKVFPLSHYPLDSTTLQVTVDGLSRTASVEERTGRLVLSLTPSTGAEIQVTGTHYRFFAPNDLAEFVNAAFLTHTNNRSDANGRQLTFASLPPVEEYPLALLATVQALWALVTDASYDIDILAPDGVSIPRSERFRQLMDMIQAREAQYKELSSALGIGMYAVETFSFRRISKATGRYVPIFRGQEVDDLTTPVRVRLPIPSLGAAVPEASRANYDIVLNKGDSFSVTLDFDFDLTHYSAKAQIKTVPVANGPLANAFNITVVDAPAGTLTLTLTPDQTNRLPFRSFWDIQITNDLDPTDVRTPIGGIVTANPTVTT